MIHLPFFWWFKIGITGVGVVSRAVALDKAVFGFFLPVCFVFVPGAYHFEQALHGALKPLSVDFYSSDGHTETFWFPAAAFALPVMLSIWGIYFLLIDLAIGTHLLPWYGDALVYLGRFILWCFQKAFPN